MSEIGFYRDLIGRPGSRRMVPTPALIVDLDAMERNLDRMATYCRAVGVKLRPHAKTHKSSWIARRQIEAGAIGICCSTIDEAEVMVGAGIPGVLLTSPVVTPDKIERFLRLVEQSSETAVVVDHPEPVDRLAKAAREKGSTVPVLVDLDLGHHRTGAATPDDALVCARQIAASGSLHLAGLQAYAGHVQHIRDAVERKNAADALRAMVAEAVGRIRALGLDVEIVTGAGTGTHKLDGGGGVFSELQAGSYLFMDADYGAVEFAPGTAWPFEVALFVQASVVSANVPGQVTTDAGTKAFALNGPKPIVTDADLSDVAYAFSGDEHGRILFNDRPDRLELGRRVECIVTHCDPTVCLYDRYWCVRGDTVVDVVPIDARGRA